MGLRIYLLGQFKLKSDDRPIELPSRPAQSLLAYMALNAGVTHRREKLASLLWPEASESNARSYLRQALWRIRKALESTSLSGEDFLQISDISVTFKEHSDYWLDAAILLRAAEEKSLKELTETASLYRGELLPGFYDEWVVLERDRLESTYHHKMNLLLERLIKAEAWDEAIKWSEQWIKLGHAPEPAFRYLMLAHTGLGNIGMVNATYQRCVESLNRELSLDPSTETQQIYEHILRGQEQKAASHPISPATPAAKRPAFLDLEEEHPAERPVFVARARELAQLDEQLDIALNGQGRVIFVTGEAGSGKTALVDEFTHRAQNAHFNLVTASGNCNAYTGIGDPYLPFREILELLTGDVEARWAAGAISRNHAQVLWNLLPITAQALVESGPDLINTFIPGSPLFERAATSIPGGADWLSSLEEMSDRQIIATMIPGPQQSDLFEQYTRVLSTLARQAPLVLVVDDLQWADTGSIGLFFHIGRHLVGNRILILGVYRPEEVALGRPDPTGGMGGWERHPLQPMINEFQRLFGDIEISLGQAGSREFVEALLDSEPNQLGASFRQKLFQRSHGHPLFTIELLRGMQERRDVVQDHSGYWIEGESLDWEILPARVEAVIAERIERLPFPLQSALQAASVQGVEFYAEVVARVLRTDEREMVKRLSHELDRRHRLIRAQAIERLGSQRISSYRFRHSMFQMYLYDQLDPVERSYLHEDVGAVLEDFYSDQVQETTAGAVQLARHYQEANIPEKAVQYLYQAGEKAVLLSAYQEGITHLTRGLELLNTLPESVERDELELALQLSLGKAWLPAPESTNAYSRARELCLKLEKTTRLCQVMGELSISHYVSAEYHKARELEEEALSTATQVGDELMVAISHWYLGFAAFALGEFATALDHHEKTIAFYDPEEHHHPMVVLRGSDAGTSAMAYAACSLWFLGYPDQALKLAQESLVLAQELGHAFSTVEVLYFSGSIFNAMRRDWSAVNKYSKQMLDLVNENRLPLWLGSAYMCRGNALIMLGQIQEGETLSREGLAMAQSSGVICHSSRNYSFLAQGQAKRDQLEQGLAILDEGLAMIEKTDERYWEAEHHRVRATLLHKQGDEDGAEASLHKAIDVARRQKAKSWELRAATDLARLWQAQGKTEEARKLLAPVYDWFTEGFDTPDLVAAQELLEGLA
jgi:predicted ATPase/DNA-binding SARP family transcriptional activator